MGQRSAPSRHDKKGVKRRRQRADAEPQRLGLVLLVPQRGTAAAATFSAHTRRTLPPEHTNPRPTRGATGTARDVEFVHAICRCGKNEVAIRADIAASGYTPRCNPGCRPPT